MRTIGILLGRLREFKSPALLTPLFIVGEVVFECLIPLIMVSLVDALDGTSLAPVARLGTILIGLAFASLACGVLAARFSATASVGLAKNLRQDLFFRVQDFSFADIDRFSTSSLVTRMTTDVTNVQNAFGMLIRIAVRVPLMIVFSIVMAWRINVSMALIFLAMVPVLAIILALIVLVAFPIFRRIFKKYDALNNSVQENVAAIRVVKSFVTEEHETTKFRAASQDVRKDFTNAEKLIALNGPVMMLFIFSAIMAVDYFGAGIIVNSAGTELTKGGLTALITYGIQILSHMLMLAFIFVMTTMAAESAHRIAEVLTHEPSLSSPPGGATEVADGTVFFEGVSFKYSDKAEENALSDIDLRIESGSTLGIVGGTGSAKTSLIQLICRLYDVSEGVVSVGGRDVRDYDLQSLRDAVSVVLQKNVLFSGTIKDNMRWGNPEATDEQIVRACELAQADEFIQQLPGGYDYVIARGGTNVSGGQKQRLCIARALLKNPKVLILDDSTSAVDTRTDVLIRNAFETEIPGTTTIIIAQRLTSVEHADQIIVLDDGRIKERGTHAELMAAGGEYREIYDSQNAAKESEVA
ncbi:ABC transporter ATP-binding protein [Actinomyces sp. oral taxon 180]|uniref:ABC transporter ATP-binding protein n=1 Tax=Actinomyces sp. oral taxon 180 TaxID=651609 RepID=UPI0001F13C09|nr:ABC transporter ATP-binding protein [Actinomyces sp. oral taxon 180]EFU61738.1 ABC superfamily ATP binding cassette transporter, membrane protein [Actinomyces sp. oral taxon 180 str. F0310]